MSPQVDQEYVRNEQLGVGTNTPHVLNSFKVYMVTRKNVIVYGKMASGVLTGHKINLIDFEAFSNKYTLK
jgi:hypothetical protein